MRQRGGLRPFARQGFGFAVAFAFLAALAATPAEAMDIKRVTSPGGIEAWLVESHVNPLIAMRFAFRGGAAQDPESKQGLAYFVSGIMDEGAGELDSGADRGADAGGGGRLPDQYEPRRAGRKGQAGAGDPRA